MGTNVHEYTTDVLALLLLLLLLLILLLGLLLCVRADNDKKSNNNRWTNRVTTDRVVIVMELGLWIVHLVHASVMNDGARTQDPRPKTHRQKRKQNLSKRCPRSEGRKTSMKTPHP